MRQRWLQCWQAEVERGCWRDMLQLLVLRQYHLLLLQRLLLGLLLRRHI